MRKGYGKSIIAFVLLLSINILMGNTFGAFGNDTKAVDKNRIDLSDLHGKETIYEMKGNKIILVVSSSCEECMNELKWLSNQNEFLQKKVDLISVSDINDTEKIVKRFNLKGNIYIDNKKDFALKYTIVATPVLFTINNGEVVKQTQNLEELLNI